MMVTRLKNKFVLHQTALILGFLFLFAFGFRAVGIGFDLPNLYQPDEDAVIMPAIQILKTGDLEPSRLEYGSFQIYLLAGVFTAVYLYLARNGLIADPASLPIFERNSYPQIYEFPEFYIAARLTLAVAGALTVLLVFLLVRRLGNERQGLIGAAITAVVPMLVIRAHFATPDTLLTFMCLLGLYLLVRVYDNWEKDNGWAYIGAAFVCGLAVSTKYNGAVLLLPLLLVPLFKVRTIDEWLSIRIISGPLAFIGGFFAGTPFALINIPLFLHWAGYSLRLYNAPNKELAIPSWEWHLNFMVTSREAPVFILGAIGALISLKVWGKRGLIVNVFALFFTIAILTQTNRQARMWLPLMPVFAAWGALTVDTAVRGLQRRLAPGHDEVIGEGQRRSRRTIFGRSNLIFMGALAVVLLPLTFLSGRAVLTLRAPDVRTLTSHWVEDNIPDGTPIAVDYFAPNLDTEKWPISQTFRHSGKELSWFEERNIDYLIFSQAMYDPAGLTHEDIAAYELLLTQLCLVTTIDGPFLSNPGFSMRVYRMEPCG